MSRKTLLSLAAVLLVAGVILLPQVRSVETQVLDKTARSQASGHFLQTPAGTTHLELSGPAEGEPVVLVHGFASPMYVWDRTAPALAAAGYRVIRFDLMGRGYSDRPDAVYDVDFLASQISGLLDSLQVKKAVSIVGYSMGGAVTAGFVNQYPKRVRRVAFIAPFNTAKTIGPLAWPLVGDWLADVLLAPRMPGRQHLNFHKPELFPDAARQFREQMVYKGFTRAIHSSLKTIIARDHLAQYQAIAQFDKPKLLLWGAHDQVVPYEQHAGVGKALGPHTFLTLENSGHAPALEEPGIVNAALIAWLRAAPGAD